jgi:hypothetical protein
MDSSDEENEYIPNDIPPPAASGELKELVRTVKWSIYNSYMFKNDEDTPAAQSMKPIEDYLKTLRIVYNICNSLFEGYNVNIDMKHFPEESRKPVNSLFDWIVKNNDYDTNIPNNDYIKQSFIVNNLPNNNVNE